MSEFPLISPTDTDEWVSFWNTTWKTYIESIAAGGGNSQLLTLFTKNGRIIEQEGDGLEARMSETPSLSIVLPSNSKLVLGGVLYILDSDQVLGPIDPNFTGWIVPTVTYDPDSETNIWDLVQYSSRPALGSGVVAKVVTSSDQVDSIDVTEVQTDVIPSIPILVSRIRAGGSGPGGSGTVYWEDNLWSRADPRPVLTVWDEYYQSILNAIQDAFESVGDRSAETENDQMWNLALGIVRALRELNPQALRWLNVSSARPGIQGTTSSGDTEVSDLGGTLPEIPERRVYSPS